MNDKEKRSLGFEIVKSFHEQFAQNQNHHQKLFLQVLAVLLTVIVGYEYIYIRIGTKSQELNITIQTLYAFLSLSFYLLSLAIALICNMALGYRRDQLVACNIRVLAKVMNLNKKDNNDNDFIIKSFNPVGKIDYFYWMPEFHLIFFMAC